MTITALRSIFARYGLPEQLVSDNGSQFSSEEFLHFMRANGIKHIRCSPYHPSSNGAAERFVRTFKTAMKASKLGGLPLQHQLASFLLTYRTTPQATTNQEPSTLFLGRSLRTRLDLLRPSVEKYVCERQAAQKELHDKTSKQRDFFIGQQVMTKNLRPGPTWVPGVIVERLGPVTFLVEVEIGLTWKRHIDHIRARGDQPLSTEDDSGESETDADFTAAIPVDSPTTSGLPATSTETMDQNTSGPPERRYPQRDRRPPQRLM